MQPRTVTLAFGHPRALRGHVNRTLVGLLAACGALMSIHVSLAHGALLWLAIMDGVTAAGLAAYLALQDPQKKVRNVRLAFS